MSLDADTIVDRRRMRRKLTFWRVLAVLVAIVRGGRGRRGAARTRHRRADRRPAAYDRARHASTA